MGYCRLNLMQIKQTSLLQISSKLLQTYEVVKGIVNQKIDP